jgi:hypothetical protein
MVILTDTAEAEAGMKQGVPVKVTERFVLSGRALELRESYCRHGVIPMKGRGLEMSPCVVRPWWALGGDHQAGAGQFLSEMSSATAQLVASMLSKRAIALLLVRVFIESSRCRQPNRPAKIPNTLTPGTGGQIRGGNSGKSFLPDSLYR